MARLKEEAFAKLREAADILASLDSLHGTTNTAFHAKAADFDVKYNEAVQQQAKHKALLDENARLAGELRFPRRDLIGVNVEFLDVVR